MNWFVCNTPAHHSILIPVKLFNLPKWYMNHKRCLFVATKDDIILGVFVSLFPSSDRFCSNGYYIFTATSDILLVSKWILIDKSCCKLLSHLWVHVRTYPFPIVCISYCHFFHHPLSPCPLCPPSPPLPHTHSPHSLQHVVIVCRETHPYLSNIPDGRWSVAQSLSVPRVWVCK